MYKLSYLFLLLLLPFLGSSQNEFITRWSTSDGEFIIPTNPIYSYDYTITYYSLENPSNVITQSNITGDYTISVANEDTIEVKISGLFPHFYMNGSLPNATRMTNIMQWGDIQWGSFESAFKGCVNMRLIATDVPNLTNVSTTKEMFSGVLSIPGDISNWQVNTIFDMSYMFELCSYFDQDLSNWNVGNAMNMQGMFKNATGFNGDISTWNVGNVTDMSYMFYGTRSFNQPITNWTTDNVTLMNSMFEFAEVFNQDLNWNTSSVTDMNRMFKAAGVFNGDISSFDVSNVVDMEGMFQDALLFNGDLSSWETVNVTNMANMFFRAYAFNQSLTDWNTEKVTDMSNMFYQATAFNQDISNWSTNLVSTMEGMFEGASVFNQDISNWSVAGVQTFASMFKDAITFNQDLSTWITSSSRNMNSMFKNAIAFNSEIGTWDVSKVEDMGSMFEGATLFSSDIDAWDVSSVYDMSKMFKNATNFSNNLDSWEPIVATTMEEMFFNATSFNNALNTWNIETVSNMTNMLRNSSMSACNFDATMNAWSQLNVKPNITLNQSPAHTSASQSAINLLQDEHDWTISSSLVDLPLFNNSEVRVCLGDTVTLTVPGDLVVWTDLSEGNEYVFVPTEDYIMTATSTTGACVIQDTIFVYIVEYPTISVSAPTTIICTGSSVELTATGAETYTWNTNSTNASINVTPLNSSTYTVIGMNGTCADTASIHIVVDPCLSIDDVEMNFMLSPNPATSIVTITNNNTNLLGSEAFLMDLTGKVISNFTIEAQTTSLNIETLTNGVYIISINTATGLNTMKFVKQ